MVRREENFRNPTGPTGYVIHIPNNLSEPIAEYDVQSWLDNDEFINLAEARGCPVRTDSDMIDTEEATPYPEEIDYDVVSLFGPSGYPVRREEEKIKLAGLVGYDVKTDNNDLDSPDGLDGYSVKTDNDPISL